MYIVFVYTRRCTGAKLYHIHTQCIHCNVVNRYKYIYILLYIIYIPVYIYMQVHASTQKVRCVSRLHTDDALGHVLTGARTHARTHAHMYAHARTHTCIYIYIYIHYTHAHTLVSLISAARSIETTSLLPSSWKQCNTARARQHMQYTQHAEIRMHGYGYRLALYYRILGVQSTCYS